MYDVTQARPVRHEVTLGRDPTTYKLTTKNTSITECDFILGCFLKTCIDIMLITLLFYVFTVPFLPVSSFINRYFISWTLRKNEETRLDAFQMKGLRRMLRVSWTAKKTNE